MFKIFQKWLTYLKTGQVKKGIQEEKKKSKKNLPETLFKWIPLLQISIPIIYAHWTSKTVLTDKNIKINTKVKEKEKEKQRELLEKTIVIVC